LAYAAVLTTALLGLWDFCLMALNPFSVHLQAIITSEEGGHGSGIVNITVLGPYMFSADFEGNILVRNMCPVFFMYMHTPSLLFKQAAASQMPSQCMNI